MNTVANDTDTVHAIGELIQDPASGLRYRLRESRPAVPAARLLLLHGVGGNETNLAAVAQRIDPRVEVLLVQGPLVLPFGPAQYAFFQVSFQGGAPAIDAAQAERVRLQAIALVHGLHQQDARDGGRRVPTVIGGFSQGGIVSASVGLSAPGDVAGFAILSGRILPEIEPHLAPRPALAGLQAYIAHGEHDSKLPVQWAERAEAWLTALGVPHHTRRYPVGHELSTAMVADFQQWLAGPLGLA